MGSWAPNLIELVFIYNGHVCLVWRLIPVILSLRRLKQVCYTFKASLHYIVIFRLAWTTE